MTGETLSKLFPPDGVIFDFDEVLADTEEPQIQAWIQTIQNLDLVPNERQIRLLSGYTDEEIARRLLGKDPVTIRKGILAKETLSTRINPNPTPKPGAGEILETLSRAGLPTAIVSSTPTVTINGMLNAWGGCH